jgi:hypothetical protein
MLNMPPDSKLTELGEKILLALWKMKGIGRNGIKEETLRAELATAGSSQGLNEEITTLHAQGFLQATTAEGTSNISLTALGLAVLRQIEEDRLQELK